MVENTLIMMEWNNPPDEEALKNYQELKKRLSEAIEKANKTKDLREAKGFMIEVQGRFKGLKLIREQREELYNRLQDAFEKINQKIAEERQSYENEAQLNYFTLKTRVEEALFISDHPKDIKEAWNFLIEVQTQFKGTRLLPEHRGELYSRLQVAFEKIKLLQQAERTGFEKQAELNYPQLKETIEEALLSTAETDDLRAGKETLIRIQEQFRVTKLLKEQRDELYARLQEGFTLLKIRQEESAARFESSADENYATLIPQVREVSALAGSTAEFRPVREKIKELQAGMRDLSLKKEHRDELYTLLQNAFETLSLRQSEVNESFEQEAKQNYNRLKTLVSQGLKQAEETHQYKETREFLKMIQGEFKGTKMIREQREELYSRLQTAFDVLGKRLDEYFRLKKKNWAVKMEYKLSEYSSEIFGLEESLKNDYDNLGEMEDQLEIMISGGRDEESAAGLKARINSARISIDRKEKQVAQMRMEMTDLRDKIEAPENP